MGDPRPARPGRDRPRPSDRLPAPRHRRRDPLPRPDRLPVGRPARGLPAPATRLPLLQDLDRRRHPDPDTQPPARKHRSWAAAGATVAVTDLDKAGVDAVAVVGEMRSVTR